MQALERVVRLARRQHGLVTHQQCLDLGMAPSTIAERLRSGAWRQERRGVYVVGGVPPSWEQTLFAVTLPFDDCWISHGTAARLWALPHAPEIDGIEALRPYGRSLRLDGVVLRRSRIITPADVTKHQRIPITSIGRTIVECSGRLGLRETGRLVDEAVRRRRRALEETRAAFARVASGGHRRLRTIREALALRLPGYDPGESDLEIRALREIVAAGLPVPVQQHRVTLSGRRYRVDLAYPACKLAIELVGWFPHSGREPFDDDRARTGDLVADGWRVLEITARHAPADYLRRIAGALAHATAA